MNKIGPLVFFLIVTICIFAAYQCSPDSGSSSAPVRKFQKAADNNCSLGKPISGRFYPIADAVNFRSGPDKNSSRIINSTATAFLGETQYREIWTGMTLQALCETDEWLQAKIIEADGNPVNWETGWIYKKFVTQNMSSDRAAGLIWNIDAESEFSKREKETLKLGALKVLRDEPQCKSIYTGYRSTSSKGDFYVTCNAKNGGDPFNVWFFAKSVSSDRKFSAPKPVDETFARNNCESRIAASIVHPSTLEIHRITGYATQTHSNGNRTTQQEFTAQNSYGLRLRYRATCLFEPSGKFDFSVSELR